MALIHKRRGPILTPAEVDDFGRPARYGTGCSSQVSTVIRSRRTTSSACRGLPIRGSVTWPRARKFQSTDAALTEIDCDAEKDSRAKHYQFGAGQR